MAAPVSVAQITNFPLGVSSFGMPVIGGGSVMTTGQVWFVDSTSGNKGDDSLHGTSPQSPFASLDFAIGQCGAGRGDVVFVLPGHTETITGAGGINCDVSGIRIIGLPEIGGRSRPTFTFAASVNASLAINAANVSLQGLIFNFTGVDALVSPIDVNAADFTLFACEILLSSPAGQCADVVVTDSNASRMRLIGNYFNSSTDAGPNSAVLLVGTPDGIEIAYNRIVGSFADAGIYDTGICTNLYIHDNEITANGSTQYGINIVAASTGLIVRNTVLCDDLTIALVNNTAAAIENFGYDTDAANAVATPIPLVGTQLPVNSGLVDQIIGNEASFFRANYIPVSVDFSSATWNTVATHEILTVTGAVRLRIIPICSTDLTTAGAGTIQLGDEGSTTAFIAATAGADIDAGEIWLTGTPAKVMAFSSVIDRVESGNDIGFQIVTDAFTGGIIVFHCWFEPLNATGAVVAGAGGTL